MSKIGERIPTSQGLLKGLEDPARRLALARFLVPGKAQGNLPEYWEAALGEPPQSVVDRFVANQWLVPPGLPACVDCVFTASDLRDLLKDRGLNVSGRKAVLIDRLIAADHGGMVKAVSHVDLLEVAPSIRPLVEVFVATARAEHLAAMEQTLALLRDRRLEDAVVAMARYEASRVFPRGVGMDWSSAGVVADFVDVLRVVFSEVPGRLTARVATEQLDALRLATAMRHLWGQDKVLGLIESLPTSYKKFDSRTAVYVYAHFSSGKSRLNRMSADGVTVVEVRGIESASCPACRRLIGKTYPIDRAPELHAARCSCLGPSGCYFVGNYGDIARQAMKP